MVCRHSSQLPCCHSQAANAPPMCYQLPTHPFTHLSYGPHSSQPAPHAAGYLSLDSDGRVVRVDTLAKLLGPGYRLGWVTGPPRLVAKATLLINATSIGAASFSQVRGAAGCGWWCVRACSGWVMWVGGGWEEEKAVGRGCGPRLSPHTRKTFVVVQLCGARSYTHSYAHTLLFVLPSSPLPPPVPCCPGADPPPGDGLG
jgi:hypothetical protein